MQLIRLPLFVGMILTATASAAPPPGQPAITRTADAPPTRTAGVWQPAHGLVQLPIWPGRPPDGTFRPQSPESLQTYGDPLAPGGTSQVVLDVAIPTMTVIPPRGHATRTAVIVFPGAGFRRCSSGLRVPNYATG